MESSNVEDPKAKEKVMQQISNSVPPEELPQVGKEYQKKEKHCDADMETEKESDTEKTPLIDELQHGYRILCELMSDSNKAVNWPFLNAVDDSLPELEDYYERIPRPMWMKKMRISFEKREYKTLNEFVADFRLMLENCYRYNGPDSYISKRGQRLETMLGQKLALLPRNLREKTSILVTDSISTSEEFALAAGLRRRTRSVGPQDSSALLNQLRQEEVIREKKARKQHMEERRAAQEAHVQEIIGWEDILLEEPLNSQMRAMWELPQIGHFLFLCQEPLYLAEVPQYELERCFLMARESTTMQRIMSSLLSTPHQRTKLYNHRHRMPYRIWEEKLQMKVKYWYDVLESFGGNVNKAADKLGLEPFAFEVMGKKNPLLGKKYHELGFYRKVWIMKSVCDHVLEHQESLREAIELQPPEEQREYNLGSDAEGNVYIHFPQFCGADLRVYRHKPFPDPYLENEDVNDFEVESSVKEKMETFSPVKKKYSTKSEVISEVISPPSVRPSRLRQNIKTILPVTVTTSEDEEEEEVESIDKDYVEPLQKVKKRGRKKKYLSQSNIMDSWVTSTEGRYKRNGTFRLPIYLTQSKFLKFSENKDYFKRYKSANKKTLDCNNCNDTPNLLACSLHSSLKDFKLKSEKPTPEMSCSNKQNDEICKHINNVLLDNRQSNRIKEEVSSESSSCNEVKNEVSSTCIENVNNAIKKKETLKNDQTGVNPSAELVESKPGIFKREMKIAPSERAINEKKIKPLRSKRKYSKGLKRKTSHHLESIAVEQNESQENSLTNNSNDELICKTEKEETDVELEPEIGRFELIVDSVQDLRDLVAQFENPNSKGRKQKTKQPTQKKCVTELHARLTYLLKELEPWEAKLIQANQKARRKMKREQESYKEEMPKKELRTRNHQANLSSENNSKNGYSGQKAERGKRSPSKSTSSKSRATLTPVKSVTPSEDESPDVSSRGRLRKRRIIPNNVENELNIKKRKSTKTEENVNTTVNKKVNHSKSKQNSDMKIIEKATSKVTSMNKTTINQKSTNTANISPVPTCTVETKSANLKQTSYPVIHQLLSNGQCALDAAAQTEIKMFSSKGVLHSQNVFCNQSVFTTTANVIKQSKTTSVATTVNLSPKLLTPQTVSGNCSGQAGTGGKIQYYTQLSNLTPQIIQQLLRNATVSKSSSFESNMDNKGRRTFVLSSAATNHPNNIVSPSSHTDQEEKSKKGTILISSTPITNPSETLTTSSTVITSASTESKALFQNSNIHTVLPPQFQVLLRTSDSSTLVASSPKICKNQTKSSTKTQGPVYVISKHGVTSHILGAGSKLTTSLPVKTGQSSQAVQNTSGAIISSTASFSLVNATVPSSVSFCKVDLLDNKSTSLIHAVEQNKAVDSQLSSVLKNNLTRSPGKYACNITVKSLLESRVAKKTVDDSTENMQVNNGSTLPINQPIPVCNTSSIINNAVIELHPTLSSSVNDSAHVAKNTCLLNTVKSQFSDVKTDQPAANLKMPASIVLPSFQPCKTITQTIQSTKTPITVTPHLMPTIESTKTNVLAPNQANILQSFSSGSNLRVNIPQPALLKQPTLMSLKQSTGQSVAFLQSGTSLTNSKNVILKVVPQNLVTPTTLGNEPSSNIVINAPKIAGQVNLPTRKIMQNELKQLGSLPQHILTTLNPNGSKAQNTTVQSVLSSKSLSTPALGLQITSSGIPLNMQKTNNQSILLLNPKDQNLQQQKTSIGVIPVQEQYNSKDLLKKVSTVQQIQGLSGPTLQIIPTQGNNTGLNNITTIQGQLLQSKNGNIILAHSTSVPSTGNITQLLHSSLNNHLTVTNIKKDVQCSVNNASPAVIQTSNVSSKTSTNIAIKGKDHLKTFKTIFSNTGASIKLKNDNTTSLHSNSNNLQIDSNNLSDGVAIDVSTCKNMITTGLSEQSAVSTNFALSTIETKHFNPSVPSNSPMSMVSPFVQPKLISPVINSQLTTNTTQCVTQHSTLTTTNKSRSVSIQPSVPTLSKSNESSIAITTISSNTSIPPTPFHQNISLLSSSSHQSSSIIPQHISQGTVSTNSILVATSAPSSKDNDGTLTLKSTSSQPISVVPTTTTITDVSKIITKLSPQNIQTNFSQIKALGQTVPSSVKNKQSLLQQKLSPISNINQTKLQTVIPQKQAIVCQAPTTILSNNLISIGQTNTSNVNVPQLVLYSIGGQLVTPQGIPVTLENGVLKILTSPVATQNQVMLVQSPNPPVVGSSQIQTISTPYTDLLKNIKPSSAGTVLFSDSSLSTTISAPSAIDVPSQMTYAVPAQGILPSGTEFQQQYSPKVITNLENHVLTSCTQDPILENAVSTAQTHKIVAANVHNKAFLFTSPSTMVNKDIGTAKQHISPNLNDIYLKKHQSILCSNTKSANSMVLMDANNLQTKHSILYPVNMADTQTIAKPLSENVVDTHTINKSQLCTSLHQTREKEDSFEGAAILLSLARQPTMSSSHVDVDTSVVSYGELKSLNHHIQPE